MSFITNPDFFVGPGIGAKTGGKSVCLNLMDPVESNQQFACVSTTSVQQSCYLTFFHFCTVLCPVAGILGARGYGAGRPGKTGGESINL